MSDDSFTLGESKNNNNDEFQPIPDGVILEAEVVEVEKKLHPFFTTDDGDPQPIVNFEFRVVEDGEYKNRRVWGETPTTFTTHENCKLRMWVESILNVNDLQPNFTFKLSDLVDQRVRIAIGYREWDSKKNPGTKDWRNSVVDVLPSRGTPVAAARTIPAEPEFDVDSEPF